MANTASAGPPSSCIRRRSFATPSPPLPPLPPSTITNTTTTKSADLARTRPRQNSSHHNNHNHHYPPAPNGHHHQSSSSSSSPVVAVSFLQPRIAVALGIPRFWHPFLSVCRLVSIAPALWLGLRFGLRFLIGDFLRNDRNVMRFLGLDFSDWQVSVDQRLRLTETSLSIIWVCRVCCYAQVPLFALLPSGSLPRLPKLEGCDITASPPPSPPPLPPQKKTQTDPLTLSPMF